MAGALTLLALASYAIAGLEGADGGFQRAGQVVLGAWLIVLAVAAGRRRDDSARSGRTPATRPR